MSSSHLAQRWYRRRQLFSKNLSTELRSWLFDVSSLTARLIRHGGGDFHVEVLSQMVGRVTTDEARALNMPLSRYALIRQVHLFCGNRAVVYARTVIPLSTLKGAERRYASLGSRPLGVMLFADRSMRREEIMVSRLSPESTPYEKTGAEGEALWGRRSLFRVGGKPLLVSEYYLPGLLA